MGRSMNNVRTSRLDELEAIGPWNYSARIPEGASSRDYAFVPLLVAILLGGLGMFLGSAAAPNVSFWSNAAVLLSAMLSASGALLSVWMFFGQWVWTAPQMALFGLVGLGPVLWAFQGAPLLAFVLYSQTPLVIRAAILTTFLLWHGWWIHQTAKRCRSIWENVALRERVWVPYECATVYRQFAAKSEMEAAGVAWHPSAFGILLPIFLCIPLYFYRLEVVEYLDAPWIILVGFMLGFSTLILVSTALSFGIIAMLVIPARIVARTGNPVLVDMMTPANAPK